MLQSLTIRNVVLIEHLEIVFRSGLCALTGETGAGKSILLDSLGLALGGRGDSALVRQGTAQATVSASFLVPPLHPVHAFLEEQGLESGEEIVLRRTLGQDGRSRAFVCDQPISIGLLRQIGEGLVEIHGQFETQGLLNPATHRAMLDAYAGVGDTLVRAWQDWKTAQAAFESARHASQKAAAEEEWLTLILRELVTLAPEDGEMPRLTALRERLGNRTRLLERITQTHEAITEAENALSRAFRAMERVGEEDGIRIMAGLDRAQAEITDVRAEIEALCADFEDTGAHTPESIDDRLFALKAVARKLGCSPEDLPAKQAEIVNQIAEMENGGARLQAAQKEAESARTRFVAESERITTLRRAAADRLDRAVQQELPPLKLEKARFVTTLTPLPEQDWSAEGCERVQFEVSTNPGTPPAPLARIASGGEMARFMLALKVVLAGTGPVRSMIFDEVDSGIGGSTADAVGERLARLAQDRQILVVTHAPQVAARATHHWIVAKTHTQNEQNGTIQTVRTTVLPLESPSERREEIARMLAGATVTGEARAAAQKLLDSAA